MPPYSFVEAFAANSASTTSTTASDLQDTAATSSFATSQPHLKEKRLSSKEKEKIVFTMAVNYSRSKNRLKSGTIGLLASNYGVSRQTISTIWRTNKAQIMVGKQPDFQTKYKGSKQRVFLDLEILRSTPRMARTNIMDLAVALNTSPSTAYRLVQKGKIRSCSSSLKPYLTDENKLARMQWVLKHINPRTLHRPRPSFNSQDGFVHIDEKWFFQTRLNQKVYLLEDEIEPHRTCKSKRFITKIMFMAAVARPIYDKEGNVIFDGKFGIWPFTVQVPAQKSSVNRPKGTTEEKPIESINTQVTKDCMINKILPAIKSKWPGGMRKKIIQQDNARPHIDNSDPDFRAAAEEGGWDITLVNQPPNNSCHSPGMNCLDLGFFRVIQTLQHKRQAKTVTQLVDAVVKAYDDTKVETLKYVFLSLMNCMKETLIAKGNNNYKLPHMGKKKLDRLGKLPDKIRIPQSLYTDSLEEVEHQKAALRGKQEAKAAAEAEAAAAASTVKAAEKQARNAEKAAEKAVKDAEKQAEKAAKDAEKAAEKQAKDAERGAQKLAKDAERAERANAKNIEKEAQKAARAASRAHKTATTLAKKAKNLANNQRMNEDNEGSSVNKGDA